MSLFDALKEKDNPYGIPLLTAGLSILANNRGDNAGAPALFAGFKDGLSMYGQENARREKDQQKAMLQKLIAQHYGDSGQQNPSQFAPPSADGAVQSLRDFNARQASPALSAAQPHQATAEQPNAYGANPQENGQSLPNEHSMRELISKLAIAGMSPDNIHKMLPVLAKMTPNYQAQNLMVRGSDGQPQPLMVNSHGNTTMLPHNIAGKQHAVDLGGRSAMVDEYTGKPSAAFDKSVSPDAQLRANTAFGVAGMNNQNRLEVAGLQAMNRPGYVSPDGTIARPTDKQMELRGLAHAMRGSVKTIKDLVEDGYRGVSKMDYLLTNPPLGLAPYTQDWASSKAQQMNTAVNALKGFVTKAVHGGNASNQDMKQIENMLTILEGSDSKAKLQKLDQMERFIHGIEQRARVEDYYPQGPEKMDFTDWYSE